MAWRYIVEELIEKALSSRSLSSFAVEVNVLLFDTSSAAFPKKKFTPGSARTVYTTEDNRVFGRIKQARRHSTKRIIPRIAIASIGALQELGYDMDLELHQHKYLGAIVHEYLEIYMIRTRAVDTEFAKKYNHANSHVLLGHGYFLHGLGVTYDKLGQFVQLQDLELLRSGWELRDSLKRSE